MEGRSLWPVLVPVEVLHMKGKKNNPPHINIQHLNNTVGVTGICSSDVSHALTGISSDTLMLSC